LALLLDQVEQKRHQKEKELLLLKGDAEMILDSLKWFCDFVEVLIREGTEIEKARSLDAVEKRYDTLMAIDILGQLERSK